MPICKNEEMNQAGTGKSDSYPRSCPTCGFSGRCARGITRNPASTIEDKYYVGGKREEAPITNLFGVIYKDTIYHEGDERSRTNPGHGYPAYTEEVQKFESFDTEQKLLNWIERNDRGFGSKAFTAVRYQVLSVKKETKLSLS